MRKSPRQLYVPRSLRVLFAMTMREMATSYGRSLFGYLWAVLEPIGAIAVLSIAFSLAFHKPALGESFPLFYATGYMPFVLYNTMQNKVNSALRQNRQLLFYPRVTYIDAIISRYLLTMVTQLLVAVIVFSGILLLFGMESKVQIVPILIALLAASILGLGVGTLNCVLIYLLPAWKNLWSIITRPLFLISTIFYLFDSLPAWAQAILWFNPLIHIVGLMRTGFYASYKGDYIEIQYPCFIGLIALFFGLLLLRRHAAYLINN